MKNIVGLLFSYTENGVNYDTSTRGRDYEEAKAKADMITKNASHVNYKCVYSAEIED
jgi:hypothetical protein